MKQVLALDIATRTGYAADRPERSDRPITGSFKLHHGTANFGASFVAFEKHVMDLIAVHRPHVLCFEAPLPFAGKGDSGIISNPTTVRFLISLAAIAELVGERAGLELYEGNVQSARKHFTGTGRAKKQQAFDLAIMLGWKPTDTDSSDACCLWSYAHSIVNSSMPRFGTMPIFKER